MLIEVVERTSTLHSTSPDDQRPLLQEKFFQIRRNFNAVRLAVCTSIDTMVFSLLLLLLQGLSTLLQHPP